MTKTSRVPPRPIRFLDLGRKPFFLALFGAEMLSIAGDQLARIALAVLVFNQTGSALATAGTYAATLLPAVVGGFVLGRTGDVFARRTVMIVTDVIRAACFTVMAVPGLPLTGTLALLIFAVFVGPAFSASQISYLATRLTSEEYRAASAIRLVGSQVAQVSGFAFGGVLVLALDPHGALVLDAATFVISSVVVAVTLRSPGRGSETRVRKGEVSLSTSPGEPVKVSQVASSRPRPGPGPGRPLPSRPAPVGTEPFWADARLRALLALAMLVGFFVVPEGLAVPFGRDLGGTSVQVGALLAAGALGGALGSVFLVRVISPRSRLTWCRWMSVGCGVPLVVSGLVTHWVIALLCWMVSGALAAYLIEAMTVLVQAMPEAGRTKLIGAANGALLGAQGLGLLAFGAVATLVSAAHSIAIAGLIGTLLALILVIGPLRARADPT